jgi:hypothetical protein
MKSLGRKVLIRATPNTIGLWVPAQLLRYKQAENSQWLSGIKKKKKRL